MQTLKHVINEYFHQRRDWQQIKHVTESDSYNLTYLISFLQTQVLYLEIILLIWSFLLTKTPVCLIYLTFDLWTKFIHLQL